MLKKLCILLTVFLLCFAGQAFALSFTPSEATPYGSVTYLGDRASGGPTFFSIDLSDIDTALPVDFNLQVVIDPTSESDWEESGTNNGDYFRYGFGNNPATSDLPAGTQLDILTSNGYDDGDNDVITLAFSTFFTSNNSGRLWLYGDVEKTCETKYLQSMRLTSVICK